MSIHSKLLSVKPLLKCKEAKQSKVQTLHVPMHIPDKSLCHIQSKVVLQVFIHFF